MLICRLSVVDCRICALARGADPDRNPMLDARCCIDGGLLATISPPRHPRHHRHPRLACREPPPPFLSPSLSLSLVSLRCWLPRSPLALASNPSLLAKRTCTYWLLSPAFISGNPPTSFLTIIANPRKRMMPSHPPIARSFGRPPPSPTSSFLSSSSPSSSSSLSA